MVSIPDIRFEVAFTTKPGEVPEGFTDLGAQCEEVHTRRGRRLETQKFQTGTLSAVLYDPDRSLDPEFVAGPYYGLIQPIKWLRARVVFDGSGFVFFAGVITEWRQVYDTAGYVRIIVRASDAFKVFALQRVTESYGQQLSGLRIETLANDMNWPASRQSIADGQMTVAAADLVDSNVLGQMQDSELAERGDLYMSPSGVLTFDGRYHRVLSHGPGVFMPVFGNSGTFYGVSKLDYTFDDSLIRNKVTLRGASGVPFTEEDLPSQDDYFLRAYSETSPLSSDVEVESTAEYMIAHYSVPTSRFSKLEFQPYNADELAQVPVALGNDIGDRVRVNWRPMGQTPAIVKDTHIDGVSHDWIAGRQPWTTAWDLTPARDEDLFILDDPLYGVLNGIGMLGY